MKKSIALLILIPFSFALAVLADTPQLAPPKYQVIDKFGINISSGQVTTNVDTLTIGGEMGLSHSISTHSSNLLMKGGYYTVGVHDKYGGAARYEQLVPQGAEYSSSDLDCSINCYSVGFWVMRVNDQDSSADFKIMDGAHSVPYVNPTTGSTSGYTYMAVKDIRETLEVPANSPNYLLWTKADGTQVWFRRSPDHAVAASAMGFLEKVIYPNGFTIRYSRLTGDHTVLDITTNTGFQLDYNYVEDHSPNQGLGADNTFASIPAENTLNWSLNNPRTVVGLNLAIERCDSSFVRVCYGAQTACPVMNGSQVCQQLKNKWPTATFNWPVGMPRAFYFGENEFTVTNASGMSTIYRVKAFDTAVDENGTPMTATPAGVDFVPRIIGITKAGASANYINYSYKNYYDWSQTGVWGQMGYAYRVPAELGYIKAASGIVGDQSYTRGEKAYVTGGNPNGFRAVGADQLIVTQRTDLAGAYESVQNIDGSIWFEPTFRNFPKIKYPKVGPTEDYEYDARGNLKKITYNKGGVGETHVEAGYPVDCTNIKTCNKPGWISDAKGNKTYYSYHSESGQIEKITYPANGTGIKLEKRYEYVQKHAQYIDASGSKTKSAEPIWLKSAESYCINSAADDDGNCASGDKVITGFEYNSDNLFLTGMTIYSQKDNKTLRTCYQYDIYGNRIGETQPKAGLASCN